MNERSSTLSANVPHSHCRSSCREDNIAICLEKGAAKQSRQRQGQIQIQSSDKRGIMSSREVEIICEYYDDLEKGSTA